MKIEPIFFNCQAVVTLSSSRCACRSVSRWLFGSSSRKKPGLILMGLLALNCCIGQTVASDSSFALTKPVVDISHPNKARLWTVGAINVIGYGGSLILLNSAWYSGYAKTSFHTFNDSKEWLQVDKVGHGWTAYNAGRVSAAMWRWAGLPQKKAAWIGALTSTAFLTGIEFLDAHSSKWGWSWSDIAANFVGAGIFVAQETGWREQRIQYKFSFHRKNYSDPQLEQRADDLFGESWYERMLKDYNAQTYWFSANLKSFFPKSNLPPWLNMSIGYGADGMFGGFENKWLDEQGNEIDRTDVPRIRQFYLAPDIDFTRIRTNKKWLKTVFGVLNAFKCPAPALMIDSKGKFRAFLFYF